MLPGKLCIGILEEDNPLKSYFRLKPILMEAEGKYIHFDGGDHYPEDGCIRIVPDKNESGHFKARMRRMGRYCVLDLREHAGENDKIRPNKNYHNDEAERNASIVYSDVVREPAQDMIFEISQELTPGEWPGQAPATPRLLSGDGAETWAYSPGEAEDAPGSIAPDGNQIKLDEFQRFELTGFSGEKLHFAIRLPSLMDSVTAPPPVKGEKVPAPEPEKAPAPEPEKVPASKSRRLSPLQLALQAQSGLNPRRNRSLQEIIEDKWHHSRLDQLGCPVPSLAMGQPAENPLELALTALKGAWSIPELRQRLVNSICAMEDFAESLNRCSRDVGQSRLRQELEDLEAERLKTLSDLEQLKRGSARLREELKQEILRQEADAFASAVQRTQAAKQECARQEQAAQAAREAAEFAQDAFAALSDGRFDEKLRDLALTSRAAELLRQPAQPLPAPLPATDPPDARAWIVRARGAFSAEGFELNDSQLLNFMICAALSDALIFSGPAAGDKEAAARALATTLGAADAGHFWELADGPLPEALQTQDGLPAVALVRGANDRPDARIDRGLWGSSDQLIVISSVEDAGHPLRAGQLDRGFFLRLDPADATQPWGPAAPAPKLPQVALDALRDALLQRPTEMPEAINRQLQKLRDALAVHGVHISRHSLNLMWRHCAAMLALSDMAPEAIFDLAFAQKALPCILAEAPLEALVELRTLLKGMPRCLALLGAPLPIAIE